MKDPSGLEECEKGFMEEERFSGHRNQSSFAVGGKER